MTTDKTTSYDFESQLRLGEMMLSLGRVQDAETELKKARDLNEIGAYTTPDDDPQRQIDVQRLQLALQRVEEIRTGSTRSSQRWWALATGVMALLLIAMFVSWVFNRANLIETTTTSTREVELLYVQQTEIAHARFMADMENTRTVGEIVSRDRIIATINADATQLALYAEVAADSARAASTAAAVSAELASRAEYAGAVNDTGISNPGTTAAGTPVPPALPSADSTPLPTAIYITPVGVTVPVGGETNLRITGIAANLRFGPDFGFAIIETLRRDDVVTLLAISEDSYWYNVETADGTKGWVHSSLAKPTSLDWVPVVTIVPTNTPRPPRPTATATATPLPTSIPLPTQAAPTELPPTAEPQEATATPLPPEITPEATPEPPAEPVQTPEPAETPGPFGTITRTP
jgi:hypothetical protein